MGRGWQVAKINKLPKTHHHTPTTNRESNIVRNRDIKEHNMIITNGSEQKYRGGGCWYIITLNNKWSRTDINDRK